jgi:hypothetical protein
MELALQMLMGWALASIAASVCAILLMSRRKKRREVEALEMEWARAGRRTIETEYRKHA